MSIAANIQCRDMLAVESDGAAALPQLELRGQRIEGREVRRRRVEVTAPPAHSPVKCVLRRIPPHPDDRVLLCVLGTSRVGGGPDGVLDLGEVDVTQG